MKRELAIHFSFALAFVVLMVLAHKWFEVRFILLLPGLIVGTVLPDIDHLIYIYFFGPQELTSQRLNFLLAKKRIWDTFELLAITRSERKRLIFHTAFFQVIFLVLTFWVVSSSGSIFGRALVLTFGLHLLVDQLVDFLEIESLDNWFSQPPLNLSLPKEKQVIYWVVVILVTLLFGFLL